MLILAIDTTGFSTSFAIVKNGNKVLLNKIHSNFIPDKGWQDFPDILPDYHKKFLIGNLKKNFGKTPGQRRNIDAIAVSANSGIYNCILVGLSIAETLAYCYKKPLIKVDHILAHNYSTWLERDFLDFQFPILVFSASGSHSGFYFLTAINKHLLLSDKVAVENRGGVKIFVGIGKLFYDLTKKLEIDLPKNGSLENLIKIMSKGDNSSFNFIKYYHGEILDLNFSDFMKAIDKFIKRERRNFSSLSSQFIRNVAASFQESITEILANKILKIAEIKKVREIHITGGISENKYLEKKLKEKIKKEKLLFILRYPVKKQYRLDNAAMIGALAYYQQKYKIKFINFKPNITK